MPMTKANKRLGEMLIERQLITLTQLDMALRSQRISGRFLGTILVELKLITAQELLQALSVQFGMPYEVVDEQHVDWVLARKFPASLLNEGRAFPLREDLATITVAVINPLDAETLSRFEKFIGIRKLVPVLALETELQQLVQAYQRRTLQTLSDHLDDHGKH